jgi:ubiquinone/menaquinone biosynthesis C-methylase UbiE
MPRADHAETRAELTRRARQDYEGWHPRVHADEALADRPWHRLLFRYLREVDIAHRSVLEIGCGRGELACALSSRHPPPRRIVAADFAHAAIALGRSRTSGVESGRLAWMMSDIQQIGAGSGQFDTVISCETLEHVPDPSAALRELHRVLRPGGRLFVTTPSYLGPYGPYRGYLRMTGRRYTEGDQPISRFMLWPITALWMRRAGFRVVAVDAIGHYLLRPGHLPFQPAWASRAERWLWPFGLHSIVVGEKRKAR